VRQVEVIRLLVSNYFDIVRNNLADLVPKALMRFLVHHSQRGLQQHLIATLYRDSLASELLAERDDVAEARGKAAAAVEALSAAQATLDEVPGALAATLAAAAASTSDGQGGGGGGSGSSTAGFGGAFSAAALAAASGGGEGSSGPKRRPLTAADRHPSMNIAAQIASSTSVNMVVKAAAAAHPKAPGAGGEGAGASGLPAILEVDHMAVGGAASGNGPSSFHVAD
jgi:hypothetical protein